MSGRQIATLRYLRENGPCTMGDLSSYLFINESGTSEHVAKLEKAGLVKRTRSQSDNRIVEASVTEKGKKFARSAPIGGVPLLREKLKGLPPADLKRIKKAITSLVEALEIQDDRS